MELQLEDLEAAATEDELAAEKAAARTQTVRSFERKRPSRKPFPEHLPRERVVIAAPESCPCCGSAKLSKLGEDVTETLEVIPRQWKVIQTVREKFSCRQCETITQPPAPFHVTPRGFAGPNLLAMILFEKFGQHQPLNRQSERYAREGIDLSVSTLADQVGACTTALQAAACADRGPCAGRRAAARRRHHGADPGQGQDGHGPHLDLCPRRPALRRQPRRRPRSTTPRAIDDRSIPSAIFKASPASCRPTPIAATTRFTIRRAPQGPITPALCWAHARRQFFELADIAANARRGKNAPPISPVALEAVKRIDRAVRHRARHQRPRAPKSACASGRNKARRCLAALEAWLRDERSRLSRSASVAKPIDYMLRRWDRFAGFLDDGRICLTNNAAERALRGFALGRKSWLFAGSERGAARAAAMATLIATAKLNDVDPLAWLADVLARIADTPQSRLHELLPWNWRATTSVLKAA